MSENVLVKSYNRLSVYKQNAFTISNTIGIFERVWQLDRILITLTIVTI